MRKGFKTIVIIAAGALAAAAAFGAAYHYSAGFRDWVASNLDGGASSSSSHPSSSDGEASSPDGALSLRIAGGAKFAATVGATKTATATLSPSTATDLNILWSSGDVSKVTVAKAATTSGVSNTLTLAAVFTGTVSITIKAEADNSIAATIAVSCYNAVGQATFYGVDVGDGSPLAEQGDAFGTYVDGTNKEFVRIDANQFNPQASTTYVSNTTVAYKVSGNNFYLNSSFCYLSIDFKLYGADTTRYPDFVSSLSFGAGLTVTHADLSSLSIDGTAVYGAGMAAFMATSYDGMKKDFNVTKSGTDKSVQISLAFEYAGTGTASDSAASKTLSAIRINFGKFTTAFDSMAYVAPTGVSADSGMVLYN
jgi:hypothetical protein